MLKAIEFVRWLVEKPKSFKMTSWSAARASEWQLLTTKKRGFKETSEINHQNNSSCVRTCANQLVPTTRDAGAFPADKVKIGNLMQESLDRGRPIWTQRSAAKVHLLWIHSLFKCVAHVVPWTVFNFLKLSSARNMIRVFLALFTAWF